MSPVVWSRRAARNMEHSQIGRAGPDGRSRQFPVLGTPYILVYAIRDRTLGIIAAFHGAQIIK